VQKILNPLSLDARLDVAAADPEGFAQSCLELAQELDASNIDLELGDPLTWRSSSDGPRQTGYIHQFRADVDSIRIMGREEEARHARRIEFARIRLGQARLNAGLPADHDPLDSSDELPRDVLRRAEELHALRTELVERNLYLVLINVERYRQRAGASRTDLIQEGCVSLFRAVDGFDWRRGLLFRTYAVHWLNQAFRNYLYNHGQTVRVPVYLQKAIKHINRAADRLEDPLASHGAIADEGELNESLVRAALTACRANFSIDAESSLGEDGSRLRDLLVDEGYTGPYSPDIEDVGLGVGLAGAMAQLSEREEYVVRMRFGVGKEREHTLAEVAKILGVSVERIRQIQVRALCKMKTPGLRRDLEPYLN
jgi:RNA polymerase sigma factor (sigma-70 family)